MSTVATNPYLVGNYGPVQDEVEAVDLEVTGHLPPELDGMLLRNGPNPFGTVSPNHHWFVGHGMVHGVGLSGGQATWYRNRWVRTDSLEGAGGPPAAPLAPQRASLPGPGAVNIISHADRLLALGEVGLPWELDANLGTIREYDFGGRLTSNMTAHPKVDPVSGELVFFGYDLGPVHLRYHVANATGELVHSVEIDTPRPTMMHDFGVTQTRVVFLDLPVVFDFELLAEGSMPFRWHPEAGARVGVMPRRGTSAEVTWIDIEPCYVFHPLNAYDDGDRIVMDVVRHRTMFETNRVGPHEPSLSRLDRWVIDPADGTVEATTIDETHQEFPRVDPRVETLPHRYGYAVTLTGTGGFDTGDIVAHDLVAGTRSVHRTGEGRYPSEAVFVPAGPGAAEGEGWLLAPVYDAATDRSDIIVVDATDVAAPPVATVHLPVRIPFGFHGNWVPAAS
jgi:carotenoid cleavage dioxygenase